ncbi:MAG TPA: flagellar assembly protein FliW [Jatrophihabitantaceae bacterium]
MVIDKVPSQERTLRFVEPLPGFDGLAEFTLTAIDDRGLLLSLRSVQERGLRFVLTPADSFFPDYQPELAPVVSDALGAASLADVELLLILTISSGLVDATANMRAPIVVAPETGQAMQVVLDDEAQSMNRRLIPDRVPDELTSDE